ncbi:MAG: hypothetical protein EZS28_040554, partial [Streblomastix strix]
ETGGVFIHIERSAAKIDFRSNVFSGCSTTTSPWTPIQHSTNIAPVNGVPSELAIFEPLWEREMRTGVEGIGLIIVHEETSPSIKAGEDFPLRLEDKMTKECIITKGFIITSYFIIRFTI